MTGAADFEARRSPLEYWYFKFNQPELAFLVDYIVGRTGEQAQVRVSLWLDGHGRVERSYSPTWSTERPFISMGNCHFGPHSAEGAVGDIEWSLSLRAGPATVRPALPPISWMRPFDFVGISSPQASISGTVRIGDRLVEVPETPGLMNHYWGRRLMDQWWWVSANQFDPPGIAVDAFFGQSRLWGLPGPSVKTGYLWLGTGGGAYMVRSPLNGLIRVTEHPNGFTFSARSIAGRTLRLVCTGDMDAYNDLGDGIHQTLIGTCAIEGIGTATGRAGLEYRRTLSRR